MIKVKAIFCEIENSKTIENIQWNKKTGPLKIKIYKRLVRPIREKRGKVQIIIITNEWGDITNMLYKH